MALATGNKYIDALGGSVWGPGHYPDPDAALVLKVCFDQDTSKDHSTGGAWTPAEEAAFWDALHAWEGVANIRFIEVHSTDPVDVWLRKVTAVEGFPDADGAATNPDQSQHF